MSEGSSFTLYTTHVCGQFLTLRKFFKILLMSEGSSTHVCGQFLTLRKIFENFFFACLRAVPCTHVCGQFLTLRKILGSTHV
jgi:hypothetical protein